MAPSPVETTELSSAVVNKDVIGTSGNLVTQSPSSGCTDDVQKLSKNLSYSLSESSFSPDSPLGDPFGEDKDTFQISREGSTSLPEQDNDAQIDNRDSQKPVAEASLAKDEAPTGELQVALPSTGDVGSGLSPNSDYMLATESPPDQVMERSTDSGYRIPSRVFTRSRSNTPVEWSVASNDSLFSIHMGNMSFTKDQFLWRLDDLGPAGESSPSGYLKFNYSGPLPPLSSKVVDGKSQELGIGGGPVGVTSEVPRLSTIEDQVQETPVAKDQISHHSVENGSKTVNGKSNETEAIRRDISLAETHSDVHEKHFVGGHISHMSGESSNSTKSFAFPILEGADKGISISIASSPKLGSDQTQTQSQSEATPTKQQQPDQQPEPNSPAATQPQTGTSWYSFFSCSSCCR